MKLSVSVDDLDWEIWKRVASDKRTDGPDGYVGPSALVQRALESALSQVPIAKRSKAATAIYKEQHGH